uniref:Uncharacterized protein n=1 Tax=Arundo donax TaxID=35708 RepID=A0A0A9D0R7_ARUDO
MAMAVCNTFTQLIQEILEESKRKHISPKATNQNESKLLLLLSDDKFTTDFKHKQAVKKRTVE